MRQSGAIVVLLFALASGSSAKPPSENTALLELIGGAGDVPAPETPAASAAAVPRTAAPFMLGVNYPWRAYGHDFGSVPGWTHDGVSTPSGMAEVEADFERMERLGIKVVRWFIFADGRAAPKFLPDGRVSGLDAPGGRFIADFSAALEIARRHHIQLMPVLFDFKLLEPAAGRANLLQPIARRSFIDNALKPLLDRFGNDPAIVAWDVINEPELVMSFWRGLWTLNPVNPVLVKDFVTEIAAYIHAHSTHKVTLGSRWSSDMSTWMGSGLDFYQFHYYGAAGPRGLPGVASFGLDKPVILGEFPTRKSARLPSYLDAALHAGYHGALAWSWRADDDYSGVQDAPAELARWASTHR